MLKTKFCSKKGAAMEWAIVFGFVMFALFLLITTVMFSISMHIRFSQNQSGQTRDLNQIGEYFIHAVETGSTFEDGIANADTEAQEFLHNCKEKYGYTFVCKYGKNTQKTEYYRTLTVNDKNGKPVLSIIVSEAANTDTSPQKPVTKFKIIHKYLNGKAYGSEEIDGELTALSAVKLSEEAFITERNEWYNMCVGNISTYTVSFDLDGGSGSFDPIQADKGNCTLPSGSPTKSGKVFAGWFDGINTYSPGAAFSTTGDITLKAEWKTPCTITVKTESTTYGTVSVSKISNVPSGSTVHVNGNKLTINGQDVTATAKSGYAFSSWDIADGTVISGDKTITASWLNTYTVTLKSSSTTQGTVSASSITGVPKYSPVSVNGNKLTINGTTVTATPKSGYVFSKWDIADGTTITSSKTVTASFAAVYTVTVQSDSAAGGSVNVSSIANIPSGAKASVVGNKLTINGTTVTATPNSGYAFSKWDISDGASITSNKTVKAMWSQYVTVTIKSNDTSMGTVSESSVANVRDDSTITVSSNTITVGGVKITATPKSDDYEFSKWSVSNNATVKGNTTITATFEEADSGCYATGTLITLADGTQKAVEDLDFGDELTAWDFFAGDYAQKKISLLVYHGDDNYDIANTVYSDGTVLRIIKEHGLFDYDLNKYVYITPNNCVEYIGHRFVKYLPDGGYDIITLEDAFVTSEYTGSYSVSTSETSNVFASGLLTVAPPDDFYNWIEMDGKLHYDTAKFYADIEEYGLYDYDVFKDYVTYEQYVDFNGAYLKAAVEQGKFTFDYVLALIELYIQYMPK